MNWQDERWVKLFTRDSGDWLFLSFDAQALFLMLLRKVDRAGYLALGRKGVDAVPVLLGHAGAAERISAALGVLLDDGCVRLCGEALYVPNFEKAQEALTSDAERQRRKRELASDVTRGHAVSRAVTNGHDKREEIDKIDKREEKELVARDKSAPATAFQAFVRSEWPDIGKPAELERRATEAYPGLNLLAEAKKAKGWETANPGRAKRKHGAFFWNWLGRAQQFVAANAPADEVGKQKADARAVREIAETQRKSAELIAVKSVPMPDALKAQIARIGNGK